MYSAHYSTLLIFMWSVTNQLFPAFHPSLHLAVLDLSKFAGKFAARLRSRANYSIFDKITDFRFHQIDVLNLIKPDFLSVLRTLERLFALFVLFHVRTSENVNIRNY